MGRAGRTGDVLELRPGTRLIRDVAYPAAFTVRIDGTDQSYVDLDDPRRLEFDYVQRIADLIDVLTEPGRPMRVIHVGGGALTLPRYVAATRPRSAQIVLEPDTELTAFVRRHLPLPPRSGIKVRAVDGRTGIQELPDGRAELVIVDAFVGAQVPADLTTMEFFTDVGRTLAPAGALVVNVTDRGPSTYGRRVAAGLRSVFPHTLLSAEPSTLKGRRFGNVLLIGSGRPLPVSAFAERAGEWALSVPGRLRRSPRAVDRRPHRVHRSRRRALSRAAAPLAAASLTDPCGSGDPRDPASPPTLVVMTQPYGYPAPPGRSGVPQFQPPTSPTGYPAPPISPGPMAPGPLAPAPGPGCFPDSCSARRWWRCRPP